MRQNISSGSPWEPLVGYSRAVKVGNMLFIAGTTASDAEGKGLYQGDFYQQAKEILRRIEQVLHQAGASLQEVVQTRMYVIDISHWEEVGRAHGEVFKDIRPAASMIEVQRLIDPTLLVEIEAIAILAEKE
jgi:enamine deaminase RidA (YjgF/YER057c/UK114 family)